MSSAVTVRPLRTSDREAWGGMWCRYLAFYDTELPETVFETHFARLTGGVPGEFRGLVAEADGAPAGLAHVLCHRHGWRVADVTYLQDLWTEPAHRGRGVGRALIEAVYAAADRAGAPHVYWLTQAGNATARRLYDRVGRSTDFIKYERAR